jgi:hypothetical protein
MAETIDTTGEESAREGIEVLHDQEESREVDIPPALDVVEQEVDGEPLFELVPGKSDFIVYARTPRQMATAQRRLIDWGKEKLANIDAAIGIANDNLFEAEEAKLRTAGWKSQLRTLKRKRCYYSKIYEALKMGYAIVPDFPINVIAVRTKRTSPKVGDASHLYSRAIGNERPQELDVGVGEYVNPVLSIYTTKENRDGKEIEVYKAKEYFRELDLPLRFVRPQVLRRLGRTMQRKVFDSIGVLPNTQRNVDPMVIGTVEMKEGYRRRQVSFLIQWWVPTESL